ncbi:MAG: DUF92 domain-containing protein, partial [Anaerolineae bacterium]|nr:DUF92 domain-containing protein [Anaerolineae bacterium]
AVKVGWLRGLVIGSAAGVFGASFDSFLGASVQAIYTCPICNKETEHHPLHSCGSATTQIRGWAWLNNDLVNLISAVIGAIAAAGLWLWVS